MRDFHRGDHSHNHSGRGKRYFGRGGVKRAVLELLAKESMHGYQMMKALEEQSGGLYVPSAGSIYPTLQALEDQGLITSLEQDGGKKVYNMTDDGRIVLQELPQHGGIRGDRDGRAGGPEVEAYRHEKLRRKLGLSEETYQVIRQLAAAEEQAGESSSKKAQLKQVVASVSQQLDAFLNTNE
ncbi:MAG: PadR family transcriptional regulator [Candidatus Pristimantibacillus sp.]